MSNDNSGSTSQAFRILFVLMWSFLCFGLWFLWVGSIANLPDMQGPEAAEALGIATCMAAGCTGGVWSVGMMAFLLIYLVIRR